MGKKFLGFHGTTRESADQIIKTGYFKISDDDEEWLGEGIYFFEDDAKQACYYCIKAKGFKSWAVLQCDLEGEIVLDLTRLDVYEEFVKTAELIKDRFKKRKDYKPRKLINAVVFNIMYKTKPYDIIRAVFEVPRGYVVARTNIKPIQIQLCVRNRDCIKTIREAECYGT